MPASEMTAALRNARFRRVGNIGESDTVFARFVGHQARARAARSHDQDAPAARHRLVRRHLRRAQERFHCVGGDHAELAKRRLINFAGAGHARRVRHRGDRAALRFADFEHDDGLADLMRALR